MCSEMLKIFRIVWTLQLLLIVLPEINSLLLHRKGRDNGKGNSKRKGKGKGRKMLLSQIANTLTIYSKMVLEIYSASLPPGSYILMSWPVLVIFFLNTSKVACLALVLLRIAADGISLCKYYKNVKTSFFLRLADPVFPLDIRGRFVLPN